MFYPKEEIFRIRDELRIRIDTLLNEFNCVDLSRLPNVHMDAFGIRLALADLEVILDEVRKLK